MHFYQQLISEELMLHEEVVVDWSSLQAQVNDGKLLESVQMDFVIGVNIYFSYCNSKMILAC